MLINDRESYYRTPFENEAEIEDVVRKYSEQLFGASIIYLPQAKITTIGGRGSIPDAIVIDVESDEWFIVEAERAVHGTWEHIAPQVSRQLAAVASEETRELILRLALDLVAREDSTKRIFSELSIEELEIHGRLQQIIRKPPTVAIPIDAIPRDLKEWLQTLRNTAKIWIIEKHLNATTGQVLYSLPDEAQPTLSTHSTPSGTVSAVTRGSAPWAELIEAGVLQEGEEVVMEYGPRGMPKKSFTGIVAVDGIMLDGRTYSPSAAAVICMQRASSHRRTANGWAIWKTKSGMLIDELYQQYSAGADTENETKDQSSAQSDSRSLTDQRVDIT